MVSFIFPDAKPHPEKEIMLGISEAHPQFSSAFSDLRLFPPAIKFVVWTEFCQRLSFYGLRTILVLFLSNHLGLSQIRSTEMFHLFTMACYATSVLGAIISDTLLGKYRTILCLSLLDAVGNLVMSMAAIPDPDPVTQKASSYAMWSTATGLLFIALGTGGIKPCAAAFGADQIEFSMSEGHTKERLRVTFFSAFHFAIGVGAFLSMLLSPLLRASVSYAAAFGMSSLLIGFSIIIFRAGRGSFVDRPAVGSVFPTVVKVIVNAVRLRKNKSGSVNYERVNCSGESSSPSPAHWLDAAKVRCSVEDVEDVKALMRVCVFILPAPLFWCLCNQNASTWVFQASQMNGHVSWLENIVINPDQMQVFHALFILIFIPLFDQVIYPFLEKLGVSMKDKRRMIFGMLLCSLAFFISGMLQLTIDKKTTSGSITPGINTDSDSVTDNEAHMGLFILEYPNETEKQISILWQAPQYVILAAAEVAFSVTGSRFTYSQAPVSMKSVVQAIWLLTSAAGDLITILIVAIIGNKLSTAKKLSLFAVGGIIAMVFMMWLSACFKDTGNPNCKEVKVTGNSEVESMVT